jgi:hypothetical protein
VSLSRASESSDFSRQMIGIAAEFPASCAATCRSGLHPGNYVPEVQSFLVQSGAAVLSATTQSLCLHSTQKITDPLTPTGSCLKALEWNINHRDLMSKHLQVRRDIALDTQLSTAVGRRFRPIESMACFDATLASHQIWRIEGSLRQRRLRRRRRPMRRSPSRISLAAYLHSQVFTP